MKKRFFCGMLLFLTLTVFAGRKAMAYEHNFVWGIGEIGVGAINSKFDFNLKIFDLFFQHDISPLGLEIIPITYNYSKFYDGHMVSFLNTKLYFRFLSTNLGECSGHGGLASIMSPFVSASALTISNNSSYNYIMDAGLKIAFFGVECDRSYSILNIELGYKYLKQNHEKIFFINLSSVIPLMIPYYIKDRYF